MSLEMQKRAVAESVRHSYAEVDAARLEDALHGYTTTEIAQVARELGVVGLLCPALQMRASDAGRSILRELRRDWTGLFASSVLLRSIYERISAVLSAAGIPHAPLKGQDLAYRVYQRPEMRPMSDIDVLVPQAQLDVACAMLESELGAEPDAWSAGDSPWQKQYYNRHYHLRMGNTPVLVEMHQRLGQRFHDSIDWAGVWSRAVPSGERSGEVFLSAEDLMLVLCYHLMRSMYPRRIHWVLDLEGVAQELSPSWNQVVARAHEWGLATGVWCTFRIAEHILGRAVAPNATMRALRPSQPRAWYLEQLFARGGADAIQRLPIRGIQALATFPLMDGWSRRIRLGAHYLGLRLASAYPRNIR